MKGARIEQVKRPVLAGQGKPRDGATETAMPDTYSLDSATFPVGDLRQEGANLFELASVFSARPSPLRISSQKTQALISRF